MPSSIAGVLETASLSLIASLACVLVLGPPAIVLLRRGCTAPLNCDSETLNRLHLAKATTPTMGGLFVIAGLSLPLAAFSFQNFAYFGTALVLLLGLTAVGTVDDLFKVRRAGKGITAREKLLGQVVVAVVAAVLIYIRRTHDGLPPEILVPWPEGEIRLGPWFIPWAALVIIAASNAVNLTDGLDGLAGGCLLFAAAGMGVLAYRTVGDCRAPDSASAVLLASALAGAAGGFLFFNRHPARVFLGDAGSLPLGGLLGYLAVTTGREFALLLIGGVFVAETLSVILQVVSYRLCAKRVFRCSPLHHHFRFAGWSEETTVRRFWIAAALCAALGAGTIGW